MTVMTRRHDCKETRTHNRYQAFQNDDSDDDDEEFDNNLVSGDGSNENPIDNEENLHLTISNKRHAKSKNLNRRQRQMRRAHEQKQNSDYITTQHDSNAQQHTQIDAEVVTHNVSGPSSQRFPTPPNDCNCVNCSSACSPNCSSNCLTTSSNECVPPREWQQCGGDASGLEPLRQEPPIAKLPQIPRPPLISTDHGRALKRA